MKWALLALACVAACGDDDANVGADASQADAAVATPDAAPACPFELPAANRTRVVVVSHPYDAGGGQASNYELWSLSDTGELTFGGATFSMGRATNGVIAFKADGSVGVVAQNDGSLGVFRITAAGEPEVVHAAYAGEFFADSVVFDPVDRERVYVLDNQFAENGGGVYALRLACDGRVQSEQLILPAKLPGALVFADSTTALLAADTVDTAADKDAHLLAWSAQPALSSSADAFPDDDAILSAGALTPDGAFFLVGDNSGFSDVPNRVGVLAVGDTSLEPVQVLTPIEDPFAIVTSPFGDAALVVSGFGDEILHLSYDAEATPPFAVVGQAAALPLPGKAVMIERGDLTGLVLVSENLGVHRLMFAPGSVTDLGGTVRADGLENIVGAIGVQP